MNKTILAFGICFLLMCSAFIPISLGFNVKVSKIEQPSNKGNGKTLYVGGSGPDNYTKIQSAINDAVSGDTVFVYDDSSPYYENKIRISKSINLIGENKVTTEILGDEYPYTINLDADYIKISNITIKNLGNVMESGDAIALSSDYNTISNNIIVATDNIFIGIRGSKHNLIINNSISTGDNEPFGILYLDESSRNNSILDNKFSYSFIDIGSLDNILSDNILISSSVTIGGVINNGNNLISENIFLNSSLSLKSSNNFILNNRFTNDGLWIHSNPNTFYNNTVNNKPLVYIEGKSDIIISENSGQIVIVDCDNITITNQDISKTTIGIILLKSFNCNIIENNLSTNNDGIWLESSSYNHLFNNNIYNNEAAGVYFNSHSFYNDIKENTINSNQIHGIYGEGSYNKIQNNTIFDNGDEVILLFNFLGGIILMPWEQTCRDNIITGNTIYSNDNVGISLIAYSPHRGPINTKISGNTITSNKRSIALINAENNDISGNDINNNNDGVYLHNSSNNKIIANNFQDNKRHATFVACKVNTWDRNYWGRSMWLPKIIFGRVGIGFIFYLIPWFNIDWHPAQEPYDIEGVV